MSEAFGPSAEADGQRVRPGRRTAAVQCADMRRRGESRQTRSRQLSYAFLDSGAEPSEQKKRLHPKMEPYESGGKRTREEETPFAIWTQPREEVRLKSVSGNHQARGRRIRAGVSSTSRICGYRRLSAMRPLTCQPCMSRRERSECLTQTKTFWRVSAGGGSNNEALLEGRAGPEFEGGSECLPQGGTPSGEEGEKCRLTSGRV